MDVPNINTALRAGKIEVGALWTSLPYGDINEKFTPVINRFYYNALKTQAQKDLYDALLTALVNLQKTTKTVKGNFTNQQIKDVMVAVSSDYPQIFYLY